MKRTLKNIFSYILLGSLLIATLTGCNNNNKSYAFGLDTGDKVKITINTSDKYDMSSSLPIQFSKDSETISYGSFVSSGTLDVYKGEIEAETSNMETYEEGAINGVTYMFYTEKDDVETYYNYVMKVDGSNTGFLLTNTVSKESAQEVFEKLVFEVEKK